jgi:hypothetical protein
VDGAQLTPREAALLEINEAFPSWLGKCQLVVEVPRYHLVVYAGMSAYSSRLQSEINQTIGRPFANSPLWTIGPSYPLDLTASLVDLELLEARKTSLQVQARDLLNTQSPEPGFDGINVPPLGRRFYVSVLQRL